MNQIELNIEVRDGVGKGVARRLRSKNHVPGIYYGPHLKEPVAVSVDSHEFSRAHAKLGSNTLIKVQSTASIKDKLALVKAIQVDPVTDKYVHIDFYEVNENEKLKVRVPVVLVGRPIGAAEGGIVEQTRRDMEIRCLPKQIPAKIEVDISPLNIGESIHVKDLKLPEGVSVVSQANFTLVTVVPPEKEETKVAGAEGATAAAAEPTVISEEKKKEKEAAAAEEKKA